MIEILFWIFVIAVFHSYVLFPFSLVLLTKFMRKRNDNFYTEINDFPYVSILMSLYNEQDVIVEKLNSIYKSDYPLNKFEILIGSDKSSDNTNHLVNEFCLKYNNIKFFEYNQRQGKPNIINQLEEIAKGEILILTDANVIFSENTMTELVKYYKNDKVGLVDVSMVNKRLAKDGISYQEKAYISREVIIKNIEGKLWGSMMGPFGGCFAIRKKLFSKVPANYLVDDFYINMKVIEKGYYAINNIEAIVYEDVSNDLKEEFRRKIRIATGNFQNLATFTRLILKGKGIGYCFFSHKILRWFGPFFIIFSLITSLLLGMHREFYLYLFYLQLIGLFVPFVDYLMRKIGLHIIILRFITHFYSMNLALLIGLIKFTKGVKTNVWKPTKRNQ